MATEILGFEEILGYDDDDMLGDDLDDILGYDDDDMLGADLDLVVGEDDADIILGAAEAIIGARRRGGGRRGRRPRSPSRGGGGRRGRSGGRSRSSGTSRGGGGMSSAAAQSVASRAAVVVDQGPTKNRAYPLGFDSVVTVAAGATAQITASPQVTFRPERLVVGSAIAPSFLLNDIKIGKNSQLVSSGSLPCDSFAPAAFGVGLKLDTCNVGQDIVLDVTNVSGGALRFNASLFGTAVE